MTNLQQKNYIRCPHCGMQYVPAQIMHPSSLLSRPKNVIRDPLGKILYVEYDHQADFQDTYICDSCNREFITTVNMTFKVDQQAPQLDFTQKTVSLL